MHSETKFVFGNGFLSEYMKHRDINWESVERRHKNLGFGSQWSKYFENNRFFDEMRRKMSIFA